MRSTKACDETFKNLSGPINCNSQKVVFLLKTKYAGKYLKLVRQTQNSRARLKHYKSAHRSFRKKRKVSQQHFDEYYGQYGHNGISDWQFTLIKKFKTHEQLKKRMIRHVIIMYFNPSSSIFITHFFIYLSQIADRSLYL